MTRRIQHSAMCHRYAQRIDCLFLIEMEQVRACERNGKGQIGASRPPAGAEIRQSGMLLKTRHDLIARHNSCYELFAVGTLSLGNSKYRRNIETRVTGIGTRMPVHKIKEAKGRSVNESRFITRCEMLC